MLKLKVFTGLSAGLFALTIFCSQAMATHIQFFDTAEVAAGTTLSSGEVWETNFNLLTDNMDLYDLDNESSYIGTGSYDDTFALHYVTLRIDPNNYIPQGTASSTYLQLEVNGFVVDDWTNPINLYLWDVPTTPIIDPYGIATNNYQISIKLTGLSSLDSISTGSIDLTNVNLEGCFDNTTPVPEPATMFLFGTGIAGLVFSRRKKTQA